MPSAPFSIPRRYSPAVDRFLPAGILEKLTPKEEFDLPLLRELRAIDDATLAAGATIQDARMFALVRGGLFYALDALEEAHRFFQDDAGPLAAYWHGMLHRREGDFDNARYWFRNAGAQPFFDELHRAAAEDSADMARQSTWDAYLFTGQCEQARHGAEELVEEMVALQRAEFCAAFDYCWRRAVASRA